MFIRDLVVFSVLQDMFRGAPAVYATFASYDEVAHHSGLERPDTLEALRKLDQRFGLIERARRYAPRPYEIVVLSDHGQTQGATFLQRNGYGLDSLVQRSLSTGRVDAVEGGDENATGVSRAMDEATGRTDRTRKESPVAERDVVVLGSGNLGLVYLRESPHRLALEEIRERHPRLVAALCEHPHIAFVMARSSRDGAVALGARGTHRLADAAVTGDDPLAGFSPNAARHLRRADGFPHVPDLLINSFYDPMTEEGCAFEELISFHGGLGAHRLNLSSSTPGTSPRPTSRSSAPRPFTDSCATGERRATEARRRKERGMCRWMAWLGQPVLIEELLFKTDHGIVDQSLHARMGAEPTNGDGFGVGWYNAGEGPGRYRSVAPAWADANLRELAAHIETPLFLAHVRAAIGSPVQQTNCHPFRAGRWLFVHNGYVGDFHAIRRDLMLAVDPDLFAHIQGSTDTEVVFALALTFGLEEDPITAIARAVGVIEAAATERQVQPMVQATFGVSDGVTLWAVRYATEGRARSLFASADVDTVRRLHPDNPRFARLSPDDRLVVSEPFSELPGVWEEIPPGTAVTVRRGGVLEQRSFGPLPAAAPELESAPDP